MQSKMLQYIIVGAIVLTFVVFFGLPQAQSSGGAVSEIDGVSISRAEFERWKQVVNTRADLPASMDSRTRRQQIEAQARSIIVQRTVMLREADQLGVVVTDAELAEAIRSDVRFQGAEGFDRELFNRNAANSGMAPREFQNSEREALRLRKLVRLIQSSVRVPDAEVRTRITEASTSLQLRHAVARAMDFADKATAEPEQVEALLRDEVERAQAAYQRNIRKYKQDEQIRVRHILFTDESGDGEALAIAARARITAGEDFGKVAREVSADTATREVGGSLGVMPRGRGVAAFEEVAFALEAGTVSGPVVTSRGVHLILVDEKIAGFERAFDEVKDEVAAELIRSEGAGTAARLAAERALARVQSGEEFVAAVEAEGLTAGTAGPFQATARVIPGLPVSGVTEAAAKLTAEAPHADRIFAAGDDSYLISLLERTQPSATEVDQTAETLRDRFLALAQNQESERWINGRIKELEAERAIVHYTIEDL